MIQFSSDTTYLELSVRFHNLKAQSYKIALTSDANIKSPVVTCNDQPAINRDSHDPFFRFSNLPGCLTKHLHLIAYYIIKDTIKNTDEQPDAEVYRATSGRARGQELLSPWSWAAPPSQHMDMSTTQKLSEPHSTGTFMETSS